MSHAPNNLQAPSVRATCDDVAQVRALALGRGWVPVSIAKVLAREWEKRARKAWRLREQFIKQNQYGDDEALVAESITYKKCADDLRRELGFSKPRQPAPNSRGQTTQPRASANP